MAADPAPGRPRTTRAARARSRAATRAARGAAVTDRRDEILQIAARRFAEFGFESATIRAIAEDAHILSGSIYHHFATKEAMLLEIIREPLAALRGDLLRIAAADADAEARAGALILASMRRLIEDPYAQAILYNERRLFRRHPQFAFVAHAKQEMYQAWRTVLADGIADGLFAPDLDVFLTISTLLRMLATSVDWFRHGEEQEPDTQPYPFEQLVDFNLGFALRALRHPARIAEPPPRAAAARLAAG